MRNFVLILVLAGGGILFAQAPRMPDDGSTQDALLAEVRALRSEINQKTSAGIRTQLLIARLQLQEQRVITANRQLADTQSAITAVQMKIAGERARFRQLEEAASRTTVQGRAAFQQAILESGTQMEQQQRQELQLQGREKDLLRAVQDAQTRWMDFNDRLDELDRALPGR